jgi:hypothetical protein
MKIRAAIVAALTVTALGFAPLAPSTAAEPGAWVGGYALGHFGLGAVFAHTFFGLAALPLAIAGAIAAQSQEDRGYAPAPSYGPQPNYAPPVNYAPAVNYRQPPAYGAAPGYYPAPGYYAAPRYYAAPAYYPSSPAAYYAPRAAYYPPAPRYYAPAVSYYGRPGGYYGARPGYYAPSGYQAARRSGNYHYPR